MSAPVRFPGGVTNARANAALGFYGLPDPTKWYTDFNDFTKFSDVAGEWTTTEIGASTQALGAGAGGLVVVTTGAAGANDGNNIQRPVGSFLRAATKKLVGKYRFNIDSVTASAIFIGLGTVDTTIIAAGGATQTLVDAIGFFKSSAAATIVGQITNGSTTTATATLTTLVNSTFVDLAFYYDGVSKVEWYVNDVLTATTDVLTNLPTLVTTPSIAVKTNAAAAKVLTVDYILNSVER